MKKKTEAVFYFHFLWLELFTIFLILLHIKFNRKQKNIYKNKFTTLIRINVSLSFFYYIIIDYLKHIKN